MVKYIGLFILVAGLAMAGCDRYIDPTAPAAPAPTDIAVPTITSAQVLDGAVILTWRVASTAGIARYRVYAANASDTSHYILRDSTSATTITLSNLPVNQRYLFRVAGVRSSGFEGPRSEPLAASVQHLSISINDGSEYTSSRNVSVRVNALPGAATHIMLSEDLALQGATYLPLYSTSTVFTLSPGDGRKLVYAKLQFDDGLVTAQALVDSIMLDTHAEIDSVYFGNPGSDGYFAQGEVITFGLAAAGERGGTAAVSFAGGGTVTLLDDGTSGDPAAGDGRYHGRWTVPAGFALSAGTVSGIFTDAAGNRRQAIAPRLLTVYTPPAPVTVSALATGPTGIALSWTRSPSTIFAAYRVYRSTQPTVGSEAVLLATITDQEATDHADGGLTTGTTYYYRVYVIDNSSLATGSIIVSATPQ